MTDDSTSPAGGNAADERPRRRPWWQLYEANSLVGLAFAGMLWVVAFSAYLMAPQDDYQVGQASAPAVIGFLILGLIVVALVVGITIMFGASVREVRRRLGFTRPRGRAGWRWAWILVAIGLGIVIRMELVPAIGDLWPSIKIQSDAQRAADDLRDLQLAAPAWMVWTHAAGEELIFRCPVVAAAVWAFGDGPLRWRQVPRVCVAVVAAVVAVTSVLFGLAHVEFSWYNVAAAGVMGLACAVVAVVTRSIWPAAALHAAYNTFSIASMTRLW
ncbi:Abortive infection protein OS=Tsukamurella paurometabola (strain ATCC 8368 / DSM / CCUG 35730/ CIP 100753 / JCM 10117 / KCTC 9821 / NBRC 16120 / NCIMB 702349 / NCTC 13040) OX=521096 GN=Tpau_0249 PE=4 SV=1 [Tsukamurella paurometabola]|uniref:Abortive infection protein n=1 Tax=Tsukamurella paurometabola (strain ATCC 8368 / DSM 20162 / CCUG 35730 / CIP 100753 / JCM 10117 / KCTC 9821 / NBRC 16120 / NCIMB 702349 / NCTC 13040) TaxID=521096 RepID=D5UQR6_TSUPD|nr:CPBP family intramembrane glutamic endopeptidase [Tsukamurella paurometabola]ADG76899.1 Abortive infection protein [Tsukamurella paurometabola DSM 20162]SUP42134.1 CAAX amino terminal protease self- immunity [Tsukamurella paurometabola]